MAVRNQAENSVYEVQVGVDDVVGWFLTVFHKPTSSEEPAFAFDNLKHRVGPAAIAEMLGDLGFDGARWTQEDELVATDVPAPDDEDSLVEPPMPIEDLIPYWRKAYGVEPNQAWSKSGARV